MIRLPIAAIGTLALAALAVPVPGQDAQDAAKERPRVLLSLPLAIVPGTQSKLVLRGLKLDGATAVRVVGTPSPPEVALASQGRAEVPNKQDAVHIGDTQVETTLTLPADFAGDALSLVVVTPEGETEPFRINVWPADQLADEQEPNDGFDTARELLAGHAVRAAIQSPRDVDVYSLAFADEARVVRIEAFERGSALDPILMLFDAEGQLLAVADDEGASRDASLRIAPGGRCLLAVIDAHDEGSAAHPYLLTVERAP